MGVGGSEGMISGTPEVVFVNKRWIFMHGVTLSARRRTYGEPPRLRTVTHRFVTFRVGPRLSEKKVRRRGYRGPAFPRLYVYENDVNKGRTAVHTGSGGGAVAYVNVRFYIINSYKYIYIYKHRLRETNTRRPRAKTSSFYCCTTDLLYIFILVYINIYTPGYPIADVPQRVRDWSLRTPPSLPIQY